jgi:DNA-binding response OmpR family regulator
VLLTNALGGATQVLPALELLRNDVRVFPAEATALLETPDCDALLVDGRQQLSSVRNLCRLIQHTGVDVPVIVVVNEGGLAAVSADWGTDDVILSTAGPAEVEARLRLARGRLALELAAAAQQTIVGGGGLTVDESSYAARVGERDLHLTFKEFELVKFLAQHPGRVFTRQQLVDEVWGLDYFGGTRTVDVHVRRLRAKLGPEHEHLIGTVRNVGYRFVLPSPRRVGLPGASPSRRETSPPAVESPAPAGDRRPHR